MGFFGSHLEATLEDGWEKHTSCGLHVPQLGGYSEEIKIPKKLSTSLCEIYIRKLVVDYKIILNQNQVLI